MTYRWGEHVGELELALHAASERGVFGDAVRAFGELLADDGAPAGEPRRHTVAVTGPDRAALLVGLLEELIFLAETEGFVPGELEEARIGEGALEARIGGHQGEPPHLVKAVTHHRLSFEPGAGGFTATVLLDV
jgi:SHS2 domain-containing protein